MIANKFIESHTVNICINNIIITLHLIYDVRLFVNDEKAGGVCQQTSTAGGIDPSAVINCLC